MTEQPVPPNKPDPPYVDDSPDSEQGKDPEAEPTAPDNVKVPAPDNQPDEQ